MDKREPFISKDDVLACAPGHAKLQNAIRNFADAYEAKIDGYITSFDLDLSWWDDEGEYDLTGSTIDIETEKWDRYDGYERGPARYVPIEWLWEPHLMDEHFEQLEEDERAKKEEEKRKKEQADRDYRYEKFLELQEEFK